MSRGQHRAPGGWFRRAPRGRAGQPHNGRHTPEYVEQHGPQVGGMHGVGMFPLGAAGRESLAQHHAGDPDRGDRYSPEAQLFAAARRAERRIENGASVDA